MYCHHTCEDRQSATLIMFMDRGNLFYFRFISRTYIAALIVSAAGSEGKVDRTFENWDELLTFLPCITCISYLFPKTLMCVQRGFSLSSVQDVTFLFKYLYSLMYTYTEYACFYMYACKVPSYFLRNLKKSPLWPTVIQSSNVKRKINYKVGDTRDKFKFYFDQINTYIPCFSRFPHYTILKMIHDTFQEFFVHCKKI